MMIDKYNKGKYYFLTGKEKSLITLRITLDREGEETPRRALSFLFEQFREPLRSKGK